MYACVRACVCVCVCVFASLAWKAFLPREPLPVGGRDLGGGLPERGVDEAYCRYVVGYWMLLHTYHALYHIICMYVYIQTYMYLSLSLSLCTYIYIYIYIYFENAHATPPHLDFFCVWVAQAICLVSVVFDRWVAHEYVCDYRFLIRF